MAKSAGVLWASARGSARASWRATSARDLVSVLLFAAMFAPVAAWLSRWTVYTPLDVPLAAHVVVLVSLATLGLVGMWNGGRAPTLRHLAEWIAVVLLGTCAAAVLQNWMCALPSPVK